jgi:hypothetical protein
VTRPRAGVLSPAQQGLALRTKFPEAACKVVPGRLVWTAVVQPTPLSRAYTMQITYATDGRPRVVVVRPTLDSRPGESLPHVYREGCLCLYQEGEWRPSMFIADTIVPWACEWLAHYEIWKATGHWCGDREPPAPPD